MEACEPRLGSDNGHGDKEHRVPQGPDVGHRPRLFFTVARLFFHPSPSVFHRSPVFFTPDRTRLSRGGQKRMAESRGKRC